MFDVTTIQLDCQALVYDIILDEKDAWDRLKQLDPDEVYALDFETTALFPEDGEIRITSVCGPKQCFLIDHRYAGKFEFFCSFFAMREWAVFNAGFEGNWIDYYDDSMDVTLYDVAHMRRAKLGGGPLSLKIMAKRDLSIDLEKDEQTSDWSKQILDKKQYDYAIKDAIVTYGLLLKWRHELTPEQWNGFHVINDAWRGTKEMEECGLQLDVVYHQKLLNLWTLKRDTAERYLRRWAPPTILKNLRSKPQLTQFFKDHILDAHSFSSWPKTGKRGDLNLERETLVNAAHRLSYPINRWVAALIIFNKMEKYVGTYGQKLIDAQIRLGRVPTRFNMAQAITGRYSSSNFNLQNIPNNPVVRRSFVARPTPTSRETRLVIADYRSIEVRVLAELAKDETLLEDAIYGDPHSRSAAKINGIDYEEFCSVLENPDHKHFGLFTTLRRRSKGFTFQLLYGAGGPALAVVLKCSDEAAFKAIDAWASIYPKAFHYRTIMYETMMATGFLPVCDGRTILVFRADRDMPKAANYPVQGAAASVMYRAVYWTHLNLYQSILRAQMAASVHDELLIYTNAEDATKVETLLVGSMIQGWLDIFPGTDTNNLVGKGNHATIAEHWGQKQ